MKRMIRIVALLMAALMAVTSCQAPDSGSQLAGETVDVSFMGPSARTITTDDGLVQTVATSDLWFQYKAVWNGSGDPPSTATTGWTSLDGQGLSGTVKLHRGTWDLSLRAFVNQSDVGTEGKCILSGTVEDIDIGTKNGTNVVTQTVAISLGYVRQEGDGTLHVSATYPVVYREGATPQSNPVEAVRKVKVTANVSGTDYTGEITAFDSNNVGTLDLPVPAGAAHVTVQYYMDDSTLFEGDQTATDVLIMATMTTNLEVTVDRDITAVTFEVVQPEGTVENNVIARATSLFDIYPDTINDNEIVIGYAEQTKALGDQTPITYPYTTYATASRDEQGRYKAKDLGLVPITVTTREDLRASGATSAWWGKTAVGGDVNVSEANTTLVSVKFVDDVTSIKYAAFRYCTALTSITIPSSVTSIGDFAFDFCTGLTSITIPDSVTSIGDCAFSDCTGLTSIALPNNLRSIGKFSFEGCTSLTSITIPKSVTKIANCAFRGCCGLINVTIPNSVTTIGDEAFSDCTGLTSIMIPNSVTSIGSNAFVFCSGLTSITIPKGVTSIGESAFQLCSGLTSITIPEGVTSIESYTFGSCAGLTSVTIPDSVTYIGWNAFINCPGLTSITLPNNLKRIGNSAFKLCTGLTSITIPKGVTSIESNAFSGCTALTDIYVDQAQNDTLFANASVPSGGTCTIHWNSTGPASV